MDVRTQDITLDVKDRIAQDMYMKAPVSDLACLFFDRSRRLNDAGRPKIG